MSKIKHDALKGILMRLNPGEAFQLNPETFGFNGDYRTTFEFVRYVKKEFGFEVIHAGLINGIQTFIFKPNEICCFTLMK